MGIECGGSRATRPDERTAEALARFDLQDRIAPFTRCLICNGPVAGAGKREVEERLPERTRRHSDAFQRRTGCGKVYWQGSR